MMNSRKLYYFIAGTLCAVTAVVIAVRGNDEPITQLSFISMCVSGFFMYLLYFDGKYNDKLDKEMQEWREQHGKSVRGEVK